MCTCLNWSLVVVAAVIIVVGALIPGDSEPVGWCDCKVDLDPTQPDKAQHFAWFLLFGASLTVAMVGRNRTPWRWSVISVICLAGVGMGVFTEVMQPTFDRTCDINDFIMDIAGLIAGWVLILAAWWLCRQWQRRRALPSE